MASYIRRRKFLATLGGAAAAWPLAVRGQQAAVPVVGLLSAEWPNLLSNRLRAFHDGLRETGYVEGLNLAIEYCWAEGRNDRLPALAAELGSSGDRHCLDEHSCGARGTDGNHHASNRVLRRSGPGPTWSGH